MKYTRTIEAVQVQKDNYADICTIAHQFVRAIPNAGNIKSIELMTSMGIKVVYLGEYIFLDESGYPTYLDKKTFEAAYRIIKNDD